MIRYEYDMLVLDATLSKQDAAAITEFANATARKEKQRILDEINKLEEFSHKTRTPIFQETLFERVRDIVDRRHPPRSFRDKANGE